MRTQRAFIALDVIQGIRRIWRQDRTQSFFRVTSLTIGLILFFRIFRTLTLTLVTYVLSFQQASLSDLSEALTRSEIGLAGISTMLYILFINSLYPLTPFRNEFRINPFRLERRFIPGFFRGTMVALATVIPLTFVGLYQYQGPQIALEENNGALFFVILRSLALCLLVVSDEILFRELILTELKARSSARFAITASACLYVAVKNVQFDLGWIQSFSLLLWALLLGVWRLSEKDLTRGIGFGTGFFLVLHSIFSLPILGHSFSGLLSFVPLRESLPLPWIPSLGGGAGGPLSSLTLQGILAILIILSLVSWRRSPVR